MALLAALLLSSCSGKPPKPWVNRYHAEVECGDEIRKLLRDPDSYQLSEMRVKPDEKDPEAGTAMITFRAKNGFGGYTQGIAFCTREKKGEAYTVSANLLNN